MVYRISFYLIGFSLAVAGGICFITYLNYLYNGYNLDEFIGFVRGRIECYLLPAGLMIIWTSIFFPRFEDTKEK